MFFCPTKRKLFVICLSVCILTNFISCIDAAPNKCLETSNDKRVFITLDGKINIDIKEDYHAVKYFSVAEFMALKYNVKVGEDKVLTIKNVKNIDITVEQIYKDQNNFVSIQKIIHFNLCPESIVEDETYYFDGYEKVAKIRKLNINEGIKCGIKRCNIGLFFFKKITTEQELLNVTEINDGFFINIKSTSFDAPILFQGVKASSDVMALVPCPYINWISVHSKSKFVPSLYVKNEFPGLEKNYDRHKLTITSVIKEKNIAGRNKKHFICGTLEQMGSSSIEIGFELADPAPLAKETLTVKDDSILCGTNDVTNSYVFGYFKETNDVEFYKSITSKRSAAINGITNSDMYTDTDEEYFKEATLSHAPKCIGTFADPDAYLQVVIDGKARKIDETIDDVLNFKMDANEMAASNELKCSSFFVNEDYNKYFVLKDFYAKKFNIKIQRLRDSEGKDVTEDKKDSIQLTGTEMYGVYRCGIEGGPQGNMKDLTFKIFSKGASESEDVVNPETSGPMSQTPSTNSPVVLFICIGVGVFLVIGIIIGAVVISKKYKSSKNVNSLSKSREKPKSMSAKYTFEINKSNINDPYGSGNKSKKSSLSGTQTSSSKSNAPRSILTKSALPISEEKTNSKSNKKTNSKSKSKGTISGRKNIK
uniref:Peptidase n=1 Tax=Parastrongyloides trichosuri TaxID=131310 RepID=A0A0N4ZAM0_PARTI